MVPLIDRRIHGTSASNDQIIGRKKRNLRSWPYLNPCFAPPWLGFSLVFSFFGVIFVSFEAEDTPASPVIDKSAVNLEQTSGC